MQSSQRETRQRVPPFPFPPNTTSRGASLIAANAKEAAAMGLAAWGQGRGGNQRGTEFLESSNSARTDPEASELCTGGKDDSSVCYFSERHIFQGHSR